MMQKYKKISNEVMAVKLTKDNYKEIAEELGLSATDPKGKNVGILLKGSTGSVNVVPLGAYLVKDHCDNLVYMDDVFFEAKYELDGSEPVKAEVKKEETEVAEDKPTEEVKVVEGVSTEAKTVKKQTKKVTK